MIPEWLWGIFLAAAGGTFAVLESIALANRNPGDTLSENIRKWLGVYPPKITRRLASGLFVSAIVAFVAWFIPHIIF